MHRGSCLCRAITFTVTGDLKAPNACHCQACRKTTGHYLVSTDVAADQLRIQGEEQLRWHQSSDKVRRGF